MDNINNLVSQKEIELNNIKVKQTEIEKTIEIKFRDITKGNNAYLTVPNDYGVAKIYLELIFDEINLEKLKELYDNVGQLIIQRNELRRKENDLLRETSIDREIKNLIHNSINNRIV